jgi:hypothetical protein
MNTTKITANIVVAAIGAGITAAALAGTASAAVIEGTYIAKAFPLGPTLAVPPLTAPAAVHGDTLTIAGLTVPITPTEDGGVATLAGQPIILTEVPGFASYVISTYTGITLGQIDAD